jgi:hypothetical protein
VTAAELLAFVLLTWAQAMHKKFVNYGWKDMRACSRSEYTIEPVRNRRLWGIGYTEDILPKIIGTARDA